MRKSHEVIGAVVLGLVVAACSPAPTEQAVWDESAIVAHVGLQQDSEGIAWTYEADGLSCNVAIVLTSESQVAMYADAGDTVAANPQRTAGVKIVDSEAATCLAALSAALADLQ